MLSNVIRPLCVVLWVTAAVIAYHALLQGDVRLVSAQIAQALLAVVLWAALRPGAEWFEPPRFGTSTLRRALYWAILAASFVASLGWPLFPEDPAPGGRLGLFVFSAAVLTPFFYAERRARGAA